MSDRAYPMQPITCYKQVSIRTLKQSPLNEAVCNLYVLQPPYIDSSQRPNNHQFSLVTPRPHHTFFFFFFSF